MFDLQTPYCERILEKPSKSCEDPKLYFLNEEKLNLAVLGVLEKEGIDALHIYLRTEPDSYKKALASVNN